MQRIDAKARRAKLVAGACMLSLALVSSAFAQESTPLAQGQDIVQLPSLWRVIFVFLLVAGLAVAAAYGLRRFSPKFARGVAQQGTLRVIERAQVNTGLRVHLIEADGSRILIAEHRAGVSMLQISSAAPISTKNELP